MAITTIQPLPLRDRPISLRFVPLSIVVTVSVVENIYLFLCVRDARHDKYGDMSVILVLTPFCGMQCQIFLPTVGFDIGVSTEASALIEDDFGLSREYILKHVELECLEQDSSLSARNPN